MTDLLAAVTPLTKGIIWITGGEITRGRTFYKEVDYLLNGLLTATLHSSPSTSHVLVSENFGHSFYVYAGALEDKQLKSFLELIKPQLNDENQVLLIDELDEAQKLNKIIPKEIQNKIHKIQ